MKFFILILAIGIATQSRAFDLREHAMGDACYFIRRKTMVSLCHPANVARDDDQFLYGNFLFSEGLHQAEKWRHVINSHASSSDIISLLEDDRANYVANETELGFMGQSWAVSLKPYELWVESRIQNPAYPYAQIDAGGAQVLGLDLGHYLNEELSIGLKIEAASMKVLKRSFYIPDLALDPALVDFTPEQKNHIVASPGMAFEPLNAWGNPRYSILWKQSYVDSRGILYSGVSFLNELDIGTLEWGVGAKFRQSNPVRPELFAHHQFQRAIFTISLASNEQTYGAFWSFKDVEAGLSYLVTERNRVAFLQFGFIL